MTSERPASPRQAARSGPWHEISTSLARAWQGLMKRWAQAQRRRCDVTALSALDEHQLKDIGLTRGDIEFVVAARTRRKVRETPLARSTAPRAVARDAFNPPF